MRVDFTFPLLPHQNALELIHLMGFDGVDIGLFEDRSHLQPSDVFKNPQRGAERRLLKASAAHKSRLRTSSCKATLIFSVKRSIIRMRIYAAGNAGSLKSWLSMPLAAGSRHITCLPGVHFEGEAYERSYERAVEELLLESKPR